MQIWKIILRLVDPSCVQPELRRTRLARKPSRPRKSLQLLSASLELPKHERATRGAMHCELADLIEMLWRSSAMPTNGLLPLPLMLHRLKVTQLACDRR